MEESDSFLLPQKELGELLKTCCHGNHLATPHLPCEFHIKLWGNQIGKYILTPLVLLVDRDWVLGFFKRKEKT